MSAVGANASWRSRAAMLGSALVVFLILPDAQANTPKHRKRTAFSVTLQPFSLVHSAVRAVAEPAYYKPRRTMPRAPRATPVYDYEQQEERADDGRPIRVALQSPRR